MDDEGCGRGSGCIGMWKASGLSSHPASGLINPTSVLDSPPLFNCSEEYGYGSPQYHSTLQMPLDEPYELGSFPRKEGKTCKICTRDLCMDIKISENTLKDAKRKADQVQNFMDSQAHHLCNVPVGDAMQLQRHIEGDQGPGIGTVNPADDGYNWRKYGQKQIKGSKYPRSYYRCTHPTCQVKKRVERALDGHITEIIYMGSHNHPKANPAGLPASETLHKQNGNASFSAVSPDEDLKRNCQEMGLSVSGVTEPSDFQANYSSSLAVDSYLSDLASQNGNEKGTTVGTMLFETGLKKRKKESCFVEMITGSHSLQPKVVVQTISEVDTLEDGYRWRKYGQKIVKGNPNPRSYYKCTAPGCSVRKQIERAAYDIRSVITSYEGKHNHEVPEARRSNSICSGGIAKFPAHDSQTSVVTSEFTSLKPEPDNLVPCLGDNFEYLESKSLRCTDDSEFLPLYQMMLQSSAPFLSGAFGLNTQQVIPMTKLSQELPIPYQTELGHSNFVVADDDISRFQCIGYEQEIDAVKILRDPKQEVNSYGSPDSTLCYHQ